LLLLLFFCHCCSYCYFLALPSPGWTPLTSTVSG
jgi:hypothetical protein